MALRPVFILSLPRSGSTLLQRLLCSQPDVHSVSEPWLLLPLLSPLTPRCVYADYSHRVLQVALRDFMSKLPRGEADYYEEVRRLALALYAKVSGGAEQGWFVDKTPRYHLVATRLLEVFPDAHFVVLWRNPLAVANSMLSTWNGGRWEIFRHRVDLHDGVRQLLASQGDPRVHTLRYEDMVEAPARELSNVLDHLGYESRPSLPERLDDRDLKGKMGDLTGRAAYRRVTDEPTQKWRTRPLSPVRKRWMRQYLDWLDREGFEAAGYSLAELRGQLAEAPIAYGATPADAWHAMTGALKARFATGIVMDPRRVDAAGERLNLT